MELLESMAQCVVTKDLNSHQGGTFTNKLTTGDKNGPEYKLFGDRTLKLN